MTTRSQVSAPLRAWRWETCLGALTAGMCLVTGSRAQINANSATDACIADPTSMACASFALPDTAVKADLDALCVVRMNKLC